MFKFLFLLVICLSISSDSANNSSPAVPNVAAAPHLDILQEIKKTGRRIGVNIFLDSSQCAKDIINVYKAIKNQQIWAIKMFDATSKLQPALLEGNIMGLGAFDECLTVRSNESYGDFEGKYCSAVIPLPIGIARLVKVSEEYASKASLRWGVCVPSSCTAEDLRKYVRPLSTEYNVTVKFEDDLCYTNEGIPYSTLDIVGLGFFGTIALLVIFSTTYDQIVKAYGLKPAHELLLAFAIAPNIDALFKTQDPSSNRNVIYSLVGIRLLSMAWIVMGHFSVMALLSPMINLKDLIDESRAMVGQVYQMANFAVDTFLVLSGLLVSYSLLNKFKNGIKVMDIPMMLIHRYLRLTPAYATMILFQMSVAKHLYQGPIWNDVWHQWCGNCSKYWWSALLYIQNFINPSNLCLGQTWYLSVDFQLFIVAPLLLIVFHKFRRSTYPAITFLTMASMLGTFIIAYVYEIPAGVIADKSVQRNDLIYVPSYTRAGPWLVGLGLGYYFYQNKGRILNIPKIVVALCWALTFTIIGVNAVGQWYFVQAGYVFNPFLDPFFLAVSRTTWTLAIAWIIIACENGYAGFINSFLSWKWFQPLARLTYCQYLVHSSYQRLMGGALQTPRHKTHFNVATGFISDFTITILLAIVLHLAIEAPMATIETFMFRRARTIEKRPESPKQPINKHV